jgi:hypothetical protein
MSRLYCGVMLCLVLALLAASCSFSVTSSLTSPQIQEFIRQKHIQPVVVEDVGGDVTVILYKNAKEMGCYMAFARNGIEALQSRDSFTNLDGKTSKPVSFSYQGVIKYDIVCLTINDSSIRQKAQTIKVLFPGGGEITASVKNNGDMIMYRETESASSHLTVTIQDSNQKELFRSR